MERAPLTSGGLHFSCSFSLRVQFPHLNIHRLKTFHTNKTSRITRTRSGGSDDDPKTSQPRGRKTITQQGLRVEQRAPSISEPNVANGVVCCSLSLVAVDVVAHPTTQICAAPQITLITGAGTGSHTKRFTKARQQQQVRTTVTRGTRSST